MYSGGSSAHLRQCCNEGGRSQYTGENLSPHRDGEISGDMSKRLILVGGG
jgi:hypothetical protein